MILSEQLSKKIVNIMSDNNIIDSHLDAAYIYCIDFALDLVLFNLSIIIIGALTHNFILSVIYVTVLVPTKMLAGGAHAGSTYACCSISYSVYLLCMLLCRLIPGIPVLNILVCLVTGIGICALSPVPHKNKKQSYQAKHKIKKYCCFCIGIIYILLSVVLSFCLYRYGNLIMLCLTIVFVNQIIGLFINNGGRK